MNDASAGSNESRPVLPRRGAEVLLISALSIAIAGYFVGLRQTEQVTGESAVERTDRTVPVAGDIQPSMTYTEIAGQDIGVNRNWRSTIESLVQQQPDLFAERTPSPEDKVASLASRAAIRAYDGAPPVVPHRIDQMSSAACLVCHENGLLTTEIAAAKIPHEHYASCTQCHVEKTSTLIPPFTLAPNTFQGLPAPTQGQRAWVGAPPVVPHPVWMRQDCTSCHGVIARQGMESTHPWRQNCLQCHASSASDNQVPFAGSSRFLPPPQVSQQ